MRRSCQRVRQLLPEVAAGVSFLPISWWVQRHIRKCPECARLWRQHERLTAYLKTAAQGRPTPPPELWAHIAVRLPDRTVQTQPTVVRRQWQWVLASAFVAALLVIVLLQRRPERSMEVDLPSAPPDPFTVALLHQHLAVTIPTPFNNPTVMAGIVAASEKR
ncbi:hypothetical protein HRbin17_00798 [bacterium HR17]|uniref:Zinc-finger domain-containing protein n=1 Tax=Candidatus Fervidibacter japonicus TaxID=2035412 RepID=A0A2H5XAS8_9BACT|nr:hypothetical protein HRbin17_00798 [bacterium HR17]